MPQEKIVTIVLCDRKECIVNAVTTYQGVIVGNVDDSGPHIDSLRVYATGQTFAAGFKYKVTGEHSYDGSTWTAFAGDVFAEINAVGNVVGAVYSTTSDFGPHMRFTLQTYANVAGTGGTISLMLALRFAT